MVKYATLQVMPAATRYGNRFAMKKYSAMTISSAITDWAVTNSTRCPGGISTTIAKCAIGTASCRPSMPASHRATRGGIAVRGKTRLSRTTMAPRSARNCQ